MPKSFGLLLALAIAAIVGCSKSTGPQIVPAGGVVRAGGKPLAGARVIFTPSSGRPAQGTCDAEGRFQLSTLRPGDGALVGPHRVAVVAPRQGVEAMPGAGQAPTTPTPAPGLPPRYSSPETSGLEFEVRSEAKNDFELNLD